MKRTSIQVFASFVSVAAVVVLAQEPTDAEAGTVATPLPISSADLNWIDLDPDGAPGAMIATLWGNHQNGAFGAFFRLPPGFNAPLHFHTHDMKLVIVSGTYVQGPEGQQEFRLGPGSYLLQPGGSYRHTTSCDQASECLFFVESDGAFDFHAVATEDAD